MVNNIQFNEFYLEVDLKTREIFPEFLENPTKEVISGIPESILWDTVKENDFVLLQDLHEMKSTFSEDRGVSYEMKMMQGSICKIKYISKSSSIDIYHPYPFIRFYEEDDPGQWAWDFGMIKKIYIIFKFGNLGFILLEARSGQFIEKLFNNNNNNKEIKDYLNEKKI